MQKIFSICSLLSVRTSESPPVIRESLSKGADRGIHIQTEGAAYIDPLNTAKNIVSALAEENFDLISGWKKKRYDSFIFKNFP